jgi:type II secretory pathway pseudopilin PulG
VKQSIRRTAFETSGKRSGGFTRTELIVIVAVVGILSLLLVSARAGGKDHTTFTVCANNVRQLALASHIYANENKDLLPTGTRSWAWDLPDAGAQVMLTAGCQKKTFYCPGTQPLYADTDNFLAPNSLWNFPAPYYHIIGYSLAFPGSNLLSTNQNTTMLPERINSVLVSPAERVLIADVIISSSNILPAAPADNFTQVVGGFYLPHRSAHVIGQMPVGNNLAFKDGHVAWRKFNASNANPSNNVTQVRSAGPYFWW